MCIELNCFSLIQAEPPGCLSLTISTASCAGLWTGVLASPEHRQAVWAFMKEGEMLLALPLEGQMFRGPLCYLHPACLGLTLGR